MYKTISKKILKLKSKPYYFANYELDEMADDEDECGKDLNYLKYIGSYPKHIEKKYFCLFTFEILILTKIIFKSYYTHRQPILSSSINPCELSSARIAVNL